MKALIIGGNRFMGRQLAQTLLDRGYEVTLLNRGKYRDDLGPKVERLRADRTVAEELSAAIDARIFDLVFDQVCFDAQAARDAVRIFKGRVGRYIFMSSGSVYSGGVGIQEDVFQPKTHSFERVVRGDEDYSEAKRQAEAVFAQEASFPSVLVRLTFAVGTDDYTGRLKWHVDHIASGQPIFAPNLEARIQFIRSDQAGKALADLGESSFTGPVNLAASGDVSLRDLFGIIARIVGREPVLGGADHSPYGVGESLVMDLSTLDSCNIRVPPLNDWLEPLIRELRGKV